MTTRTISLPDETMEFAEAQARREGYDSVDAYINAVLYDIRLREAKRKFEARLREAMESGPSEPVTEETWEEIRSAGLARLEAEQRGQ
jgi:Arc/MetJ-type ribon-helix-helix transcriptional regulator